MGQGDRHPPPSAGRVLIPVPQATTMASEEEEKRIMANFWLLTATGCTLLSWAVAIALVCLDPRWCNRPWTGCITTSFWIVVVGSFLGTCAGLPAQGGQGLRRRTAVGVLAWNGIWAIFLTIFLLWNGFWVAFPAIFLIIGILGLRGDHVSRRKSRCGEDQPSTIETKSMKRHS